MPKKTNTTPKTTKTATTSETPAKRAKKLTNTPTQTSVSTTHTDAVIPGKRPDSKKADNKAAASALLTPASSQPKSENVIAKKLSERAVQLEELKKLREKFNGRLPTQREINVHIGVTFRTAAQLQAILNELQSSKVCIKPIVNKTLTETVTKMIEENINLHIEQLNEKLELIEKTEEALKQALELLEQVFNPQTTSTGKKKKRSTGSK